METTRTNDILSTDVDAFRREVNRLAQEEFDNALEMAMKSFPLMGLVRFEDIAQNLQSFSYTPQMPDYLMADDAEDFDCGDNDSPVYQAEGKPYRGETANLTKRYELCMIKCQGKTLREEVRKKLKGVMQVILLKLYKTFWYGRPDLGQFGLLNHPMLADHKIESPFVWSRATDNQIAMQLAKAMKHMVNPKVIVAENIYNNSIGLAKEGDGAGATCSIRSGCINAIIQAQDGINFDGTIRSSEDLNANNQHGDMVIVYDAEGAYMTKAEPLLIAATPSGTSMVTGRAIMNTAGLHIEFTGSVKQIEGAGAPANG